IELTVATPIEPVPDGVAGPGSRITALQSRSLRAGVTQLAEGLLPQHGGRRLCAPPPPPSSQYPCVWRAPASAGFESFESPSRTKLRGAETHQEDLRRGFGAVLDLLGPEERARRWSA